MNVRITTTPQGVRYVYTVEGYRDERGKAKQRMVAKHGREDVLLAADPDAIAKLEAQAAEWTATRRGRRGTLAFDTALPSDDAAPLNLGWLLADAVFDRLGVEKAARRAAKRHGWDIDVAEILRALVAARVIHPGSKRAAAARADTLWAGPELDLGQAYRALDHIADITVDLQRAASEGVVRPPAALNCVDYDLTNYYFEIDQPDPAPKGKTAARGEASRQRGHSKEGRQDPIIQMGLFLDGDGLPVSYRLFDGNVPDTSTLPTALTEFKQTFHPGRIVVVADKALNTDPNLGALYLNGDGWIVSASARNGRRQLKDWVVSPEGWTVHEDGTKTKSMIVKRIVRMEMLGVEGLPVGVLEKVVARWSPVAAERDRRTRDDMLARAEKLAADEPGYRASNKRGVKKYIKTHTLDPATGEVLDTKDALLTVDHERAEREAVLDGYHVIRTSETKLADGEVVERYHQLWRIEQTFRVSKTDLRTRPVHVWSRRHIEAHFAVCYLALLVTRLLERWTGLPSGRLLDAVRRFEAVPAGPDVYRILRPVDWDLIDLATGSPLDQTWALTTELRAWRRALVQACRRAEYTTSETT